MHGLDRGKGNQAYHFIYIHQTKRHRSRSLVSLTTSISPRGTGHRLHQTARIAAVTNPIFSQRAAVVCTSHPPPTTHVKQALLHSRPCKSFLPHIPTTPESHTYGLHTYAALTSVGYTQLHIPSRSPMGVPERARSRGTSRILLWHSMGSPEAPLPLPRRQS